MRHVFLAGEEADERPPNVRDVIADRATKHRIAGFESVEDCPSCNRPGVDVECDLGVDVGENAQVVGKQDANHGCVLPIGLVVIVCFRNRADRSSVAPEGALFRMVDDGETVLVFPIGRKFEAQISHLV